MGVAFLLVALGVGLGIIILSAVAIGSGTRAEAFEVAAAAAFNDAEPSFVLAGDMAGPSDGIFPIQ